MKGRIKRPEAQQSRLILPRVGQIKIGMKNANGYPQSVDYFIPTGKYAGLFTQAYGEKPQTIQIVFPDDDPAKVCNERYEYRDDDGRLIAAGDGDTFQVWDGKKIRNVDNGKIPKFNAVNNEALPEQKEPPTRLRRLGGYINAKLYCSVGSWGCRGLAIRHKRHGVHNSANSGNVRRYVSGTGILQRHYLWFECTICHDPKAGRPFPFSRRVVGSQWECRQCFESTQGVGTR